MTSKTSKEWTQPIFSNNAATSSLASTSLGPEISNRLRGAIFSSLQLWSQFGMNVVVKMEGIGIQVKGITWTIKSLIDSYVTRNKTPNSTMVTKFWNSEGKCQCFALWVIDRLVVTNRTFKNHYVNTSNFNWTLTFEIIQFRVW